MSQWEESKKPAQGGEGKKAEPGYCRGRLWPGRQTARAFQGSGSWNQSLVAGPCTAEWRSSLRQSVRIYWSAMAEEPRWDRSLEVRRAQPERTRGPGFTLCPKGKGASESR